MQYRWESQLVDERTLAKGDREWLIRREQELGPVSSTWWLSLLRESPVAIKTSEVVAALLLSLGAEGSPIGGGCGVFVDTSMTLDELFEELAHCKGWEPLVSMKNAAIEAARSEDVKLVLYTLGSDGSGEGERQRMLQAMRAMMDARAKGNEYSSLVF